MKYLAKFYLTINDPLPVLPGSDQDHVHKNIVNTYLFDQVCKTGILDGDYMPNLCQIFHKKLIETPVLGRNV